MTATPSAPPGWSSSLRKYSNLDWRFLCLAKTYAKYCKKYDGEIRYNDWVTVGRSDPNYGVINWRLPNDAVVGVIGDWGTGLDDAEALLTDLVHEHKPAAIIHLGDIYYSGTPDSISNGSVIPGECRANYADVISRVFVAAGKRIPVFTLAGNHDYYALGQGKNGFYETFNTMNDAIPGAEQQASYFCLRTLDDGWQFLAMDTGYDDSNPKYQYDPLYAGPKLQPTEVEWLQLQLASFPGATVLLSHHQAFSAHAKLNGELSAYPDLPSMNPYLREAFVAHFAGDVAAWLWGHEHNFAAYRDGLFGLAKGRLVGCSAYEELTAFDPYKVNNVLGAWRTPALSYYTPGSASQVWTVQKRNPTTPEVHYGDEVCFINKGYAGQSLQPYWSTLWSARYLTTKGGDPYYWTVPALTSGGFGPNED